MTIKQQGGIFGRNPTFNDLSTETLSIGGTELSSTATELNFLDGASTSAVVASKAVLANSSGNVAFPSGKGIDFSATSGTGTSELFDDYEEGTYTPALEGMTGGAVTYTSQFGRYTKIGRQVNVFFSITVNTNTNTGGNTRVSVPFVADVGGSNYIYVGSIGRNTTSNSVITHVSFFSGIAAALFFTPALGTLNGSAVTNGSVLSGSITYFV